LAETNNLETPFLWKVGKNPNADGERGDRVRGFAFWASAILIAFKARGQDLSIELDPMSVGRDIDESVGLSIVTATGNAPKFAGDDTPHDVDVLLSTKSDLNRLSPCMYDAARQWDSRAAVQPPFLAAFLAGDLGTRLRAGNGVSNLGFGFCR